MSNFINFIHPTKWNWEKPIKISKNPSVRICKNKKTSIIDILSLSHSSPMTRSQIPIVHTTLVPPQSCPILNISKKQ